MSKVFAIYPLDKSSSTSFLNRIHTFETRMLGDAWHCYKVHFSDDDHERCIQQAMDSHFIFFMGHGGDTQLHGACAKYGEMTVDSAAVQENKDFYDKEIKERFSFVFPVIQIRIIQKVLQGYLKLME